MKLGFVTSMINSYLIGITCMLCCCWEHYAERNEESQIAEINLYLIRPVQFPWLLSSRGFEISMIVKSSYEFWFVLSQFLWESELNRIFCFVDIFLNFFVDFFQGLKILSYFIKGCGLKKVNVLVQNLPALFSPHLFQGCFNLFWGT